MINIIIHNIYNNPIYPSLKTNLNILRKTLLSSTAEVSFYNHHGNIYIKNNGIAMEFTFGSTFSNFLMVHIKNKVLNL